MKTKNRSTILQTLPNKVLRKNKVALKSFSKYKEMADILERANLASGKKASFQINTGSALKAQINLNGISSTQKI